MGRREYMRLQVRNHQWVHVRCLPFPTSWLNSINFSNFPSAQNSSSFSTSNMNKWNC